MFEGEGVQLDSRGRSHYFQHVDDWRSVEPAEQYQLCHGLRGDGNHGYKGSR